MDNKNRNIVKNKILKCLTEDFKNNQAIFNKKEGYQIFNGTDLEMVMDAVTKGIDFAKEEINQDWNSGILMTKYFSNDGHFYAPVAKNCPFCGTHPDVLVIGNNHTKSRKVTIKCKKCRVQLTNAGLKFDSETLAKSSIKAWNYRCT